VPRARNTPGLTTDGRSWAIDNGAYSGWDADAFVALLERMEGWPGCLFAAVPDVVSDAPATLRRFRAWAPMVREYRFPVALVAQDGLLPPHVPWDQIAALFLGGTTEWKLGVEARTLAGYAKAHGKWLHMGRVNSRRRLRYAESIGCDSIDGSSFSRWGDTHIPRAVAWIDECTTAPRLF
jgi:hypothetical protein